MRASYLLNHRTPGWLVGLIDLGGQGVESGLVWAQGEHWFACGRPAYVSVGLKAQGTCRRNPGPHACLRTVKGFGLKTPWCPDKDIVALGLPALLPDDGVMGVDGSTVVCSEDRVPATHQGASA
eukprot:351323-Pyramimonas_sp.AAC.3